MCFLCFAQSIKLSQVHVIDILCQNETEAFLLYATSQKTLPGTGSWDYFTSKEAFTPGRQPGSECRAEVEAGEETTVTEGPVPGSPVVRTLDEGTDPTHGWTTKMPQAASWGKKKEGSVR